MEGASPIVVPELKSPLSLSQWSWLSSPECRNRSRGCLREGGREGRRERERECERKWE